MEDIDSNNKLRRNRILCPTTNHKWKKILSPRTNHKRKEDIEGNNKSQEERGY